jgi:hypothetical protein
MAKRTLWMSTAGRISCDGTIVDVRASIKVRDTKVYVEPWRSKTRLRVSDAGPE